MSEQSPSGEVLVYQAPDGEVRVDVRLERETVWLSQRQIAELLDTSTDNVGLHLQNIFEEGELAEAATTEDSSVVQVEGRRQVQRRVKNYNLDAIVYVGYRVNSKRGTQFRIWATRTLRDHLLRGYTRRATELLPVDRDSIVGNAPMLDRFYTELRVGALDEAVHTLDAYLSRPGPFSLRMLRLDPRLDALKGNQGFEEFRKRKESR